ncbi:hypothetical protein BJX99DRAFT_248480 [Aspergillus californicus]
MASEFIGYNVLVTLRTPPDATVQGEVADVIGQRLMLRNVALSWISYPLATYSIDAPDIADLSLKPLPETSGQVPPVSQEKQSIPPPFLRSPAQQPFVDPAILSFTKPSTEVPIGAKPPKSVIDVPGTRPFPVPQTLSHDIPHATPVPLTESFSNLELDVDSRASRRLGLEKEPQAHGADQEPTVHHTPSRYGTTRSRRGGNPKPSRAYNEHNGALNTNPKSRGWRQTAFVEPFSPNNSKSPQLYGEVGSLNGKRRKIKSRGYAEQISGWATEDATDIQELGEFDFESNLSKFDKRRVFEEIRNDDTTADEERLVSFNRRVPKIGTNGGRNLHWTENVLDETPEESDNAATDREPSDAKLSSETYSGRDIRPSARGQGSRKGSGIFGQPLVATQINTVGRKPLSNSRTNSPLPTKTPVSASPITGPNVPSATLRLATTNRSCPTVSPLQILEVEQLAIGEVGLTEDMLTENAGRSIAEAAVGLLSSEAAAPTILVLIGNHRTGARAICSARHLRNRGHRVTVCMLGIEHDPELPESCRKQLDVFKKIGGRFLRWEEVSSRLSTSEFAPDLVLDALFGIHISFNDLRTDDQAAAFEMISWVNRSNLDVLSVDVPSGLSAMTGEVMLVEGRQLRVSSKAVVCLGAPKTGLLNALLVGEGTAWNLFVADVGIPQIAWRKYGTRRRHGIDFGNRWVITHSEWASEDAYSASAGSGVNKGRRGGADTSFKRLPFRFCSLSLQPFEHPVCTATGTIFDLTNILPWIKKHGTNPVDGSPLKGSDLIKLKIAKNDADEFIDPVTFKVLTDNTHIVALRNTGNVFAWDTVERLNVKGKLWRDLVTDEEFGRKDIITLQDPQNIESRNLNSFNYIKEGESGLSDEQLREREDPSKNVNAGALGSSAKILKAREAVAKARQERAQRGGSAASSASLAKADAPAKALQKSASLQAGKPVPYNAAKYTTGLAAASFTSTGMTPHTSADLALLSDEEYMLKRGRVKQKGYARISTTSGDINIELQTEYAPKAVWNFIKLAKKGYYKDVTFHRNIKGFMLQGGDPTGTGRGGESIWGKYFEDEFEGPLKHDSRGTISMANKGKNTNSSQFFIAYRALPHLNLKHTIFAHVIDDPTPSSPTIDRLETHPVNATSNKPTPDVRIIDVTVFVDPFEEFLKKKQLESAGKTDGQTAEDEEQAGRRADDDHVTWTGKRVRGAGTKEETSAEVGKYLQAALSEQAGQDEDEIIEFVDDEPEPEPMRKKVKGSGGFGDFSSWD